MLIAFEGPDNTGKSTSAASLTHNHQVIYNATKENHALARQDLQGEQDLVQCFDRIDWFSHMVYRLALPDRDWNDARNRTVFAMPDTHLVIKIHHPDLANFTADEVVDTPVGKVNPVYYYFADFFTGLNEEREYELFKTVSIIEVCNDIKFAPYSQRLVAFSSPAIGVLDALERGVNSDDSLLELLRDDERQRI